MLSEDKADVTRSNLYSKCCCWQQSSIWVASWVNFNRVYVVSCISKVAWDHDTCYLHLQQKLLPGCFVWVTSALERKRSTPECVCVCVSVWISQCSLFKQINRERNCDEIKTNHLVSRSYCPVYSQILSLILVSKPSAVTSRDIREHRRKRSGRGFGID